MLHQHQIEGRSLPDSNELAGPETLGSQSGGPNARPLAQGIVVPDPSWIRAVDGGDPRPPTPGRLGKVGSI
jgi:hypothetical protein